MKKLSFEEFEKHINKIKILFERDDRFNEVIKELTFDGYAFIYGDAISQLIELLSFVMEDDTHSRDGGWIEYFIYDLNFGKDWHVGSVTAADGKTDIPLATVRDLYNLLMEKENDR